MRNKKLRSALPRCLLSALLMGGIATTATVRAANLVCTTAGGHCFHTINTDTGKFRA